LQAAGFAVERVQPYAAFGEDRCRHCAIAPFEELWLCRPGRESAAATGR
jgi:hypothetical protein